MLFWDVVPLKFSIPAVTEDLDEATGRFPHCLSHSLWAFLAVFPVVASVGSSQAGGRSDDALRVLCEHLIVYARIAIEILFLVGFRDQFKEIVESRLVLCQED